MGRAVGEHDRRQSRPDYESPLSRFLLSDTRLAGVWLVARVYLGYLWTVSGVSVLRELTTVAAGGRPTALWPPLPLHVLRLNPAVASLLGVSEVAVGLFLILGVLTGLTAFISVVLSVNALSPGPPAGDPIAFSTTLVLILAWRTAGWYGADRWLFRDLLSPRTSPSDDSDANRTRIPGLNAPGVDRALGEADHDTHP